VENGECKEGPKSEYGTRTMLRQQQASLSASTFSDSLEVERMRDLRSAPIAPTPATRSRVTASRCAHYHRDWTNAARS
jgi:hypothetical protein